jgi:hypothetical protein
MSIAVWYDRFITTAKIESERILLPTGNQRKKKLVPRPSGGS